MSVRRGALVLVLSAGWCGTTAAPAAALNPLKSACGVAGIANPLAGGACKNAAGAAGGVAKAGAKLATGQVGGAVSTLVSGGAALGLSAIEGWVLGGASFALQETAKLIGETTAPQLQTTWFSSAYWRMAGIAAVLTLPFLFAAVVQALLRSDLALLVRATFGYLPLAILSVSIAAPMTMLLLAASDQMSAVVSSAAGHSGSHYLAQAASTLVGLSPFPGAPFLAFLVGVFTAAGAVVLWFELLMRDAAVYVIVLMLPLAFAAMVWPARRIWVVRAVELLIALIFSKFVIVAVLSLGGAALSGGARRGVAGWLAGLVILTLGAFAPWAMLRLLPLAELASSAAGSLRGEGRVGRAYAAADKVAHSGHEWATATTGHMRRELAAMSEDLRGAGDGQRASSSGQNESNPVQGTDLNGVFGAADRAAGDPGGDPDGGHGGDPGLDPQPEPTERSAGGTEPWQADSFSLGTLVLGEEAGAAPRFPAHAPRGPDAGFEPPSGAVGTGGVATSPGATATPPGSAPAPADPTRPPIHPPLAGTQVTPEGSPPSRPDRSAVHDDPDPLPAPQDPPDGRL